MTIHDMGPEAVERYQVLCKTSTSDGLNRPRDHGDNRGNVRERMTPWPKANLNKGMREHIIVCRRVTIGIKAQEITQSGGSP